MLQALSHDGCSASSDALAHISHHVYDRRLADLLPLDIAPAPEDTHLHSTPFVIAAPGPDHDLAILRCWGSCGGESVMRQLRSNLQEGVTEIHDIPRHRLSHDGIDEIGAHTLGDLMHTMLSSASSKDGSDCVAIGDGGGPL